MGMTIDKTIDFFNGLECHTPQAKDAKDVAVNTMHKYQQIEQILDDCDLEAWEVLEMIKEVVVDGNDTTNKRRTKSIP
jgi:hypothetical protein